MGARDDLRAFEPADVFGDAHLVTLGVRRAEDHGLQRGGVSHLGIADRLEIPQRLLDRLARDRFAGAEEREGDDGGESAGLARRVSPAAVDLVLVGNEEGDGVRHSLPHIFRSHFGPRDRHNRYQ